MKTGGRDLGLGKRRSVNGCGKELRVGKRGRVVGCIKRGNITDREKDGGLQAEEKGKKGLRAREKGKSQGLANKIIIYVSCQKNSCSEKTKTPPKS